MSPEELAHAFEDFVSKESTKNADIVKKQRQVITQLKKEKRYYIITLSFFCFMLAGGLFWSLEKPEHNFDCEIVINEKEEVKWL